MKQIFAETEIAKVLHFPRVLAGYQGEKWVDWRTNEITVATTAHYDEGLKVLVIDRFCSDEDVPGTRVLATVDTEAKAIRRAVEAADYWRAEVARLAPDEHPAFGLEGEALAEAERAIVAEYTAKGWVQYPDY